MATVFCLYRFCDFFPFSGRSLLLSKSIGLSIAVNFNFYRLLTVCFASWQFHQSLQKSLFPQKSDWDCSTPYFFSLCFQHHQLHKMLITLSVHYQWPVKTSWCSQSGMKINSCYCALLELHYLLLYLCHFCFRSTWNNRKFLLNLITMQNETNTFPHNALHWII